MSVLRCLAREFSANILAHRGPRVWNRWRSAILNRGCKQALPAQGAYVSSSVGWVAARTGRPALRVALVGVAQRFCAAINVIASSRAWVQRVGSSVCKCSAFITRPQRFPTSASWWRDWAMHHPSMFVPAHHKRSVMPCNQNEIGGMKQRRSLWPTQASGRRVIGLVSRDSFGTHKNGVAITVVADGAAGRWVIA